VGLVFEVLILPLVLVLVLLVVVLQLVGVLEYLIHMLLLAELAEGRLGIPVSLGFLVLFLQCQELVRRQLLVCVIFVGSVVLGMMQLVLIVLATIQFLLVVLS
jgi:hypothetical protein